LAPSDAAAPATNTAGPATPPVRITRSAAAAVPAAVAAAPVVASRAT
jgi:hypothetical protein